MKIKPNPQAEKTREILRKHDGHLLDEFVRPAPKGCKSNCTLEFWYIQSKGMVILQVWTEGNGCSSYANWPTGNTFDELEAFLAK